MRKKFSIRMIIISSFIILMIIAFGVEGYIVFSSWLSSVDENITQIAENINDKIYHEIDMFFNIPQNMNEVNRGLIENDVVDIKKEAERERFFVEVLKAYSDDIYSFSYGTEDGEYYGARRNENNIIEIMRNDASTGNHSWYYSVTETLTAGEPVLDAGRFDPRTRGWYKEAKKTKGLVFSPIYKHFVMDDLAISVSMPIYNKTGALQGVLGSHVTLSRIDHYLKAITKDKNAFAIIIEKNTEELVANSMNISQISTLENGIVKRMLLDEINNQAVHKAYKRYKNTGNKNFKIKDGQNKLYINLIEYHKEGLDWILITGVPESIFTAGIMDSIKLVVVLTLVTIMIAIIIYLKLVNKFLKPIDHLIETTERFSQGEFLQRANIIRDDEIGNIAKAFNKMADIILNFVNDLEEKVRERTKELEDTNEILREHKENLQLILDSTFEGIYGMDLEGKCTFCNVSGMKILGYTHQDELLGTDIHLKIHHSYKDGTQMPLNECRILKALLEGKGVYVEDEVFWRADGTYFDVVYYSYPQYKDGKLVGAVVTFMDHTEQKKNQEHIQYLSYHDSLTGVYNRMFFEDELKRVDIKKNLPLSVIYGDLNGLKLTNDIFGHAAGDELLKKTANILKQFCREEDIVARLGGDEFGILLPNTEEKDAQKIMNRIKREISKEKIVAIKGSLAMGYATKTRSDQSIEMVIENAETNMYSDKMLNRKNIEYDMVEEIIETLHNKSSKGKQHSIRVSELCQDIGQAMNLSDAEIKKIKEAGFLHDIGKIILNENILIKKEDLTEEEKKEIYQHPVIGFRILNLFQNTLDLAEGVLYHHENWDGSGYPKGLKGEEIPKISRIIRVAETYEALTSSFNKNPINKEEALKEIRRQAGIKLDPEIVDIFINRMSDK